MVAVKRNDSIQGNAHCGGRARFRTMRLGLDRLKLDVGIPYKKTRNLQHALQVYTYTRRNTVESNALHVYTQ